MSLKIPKHLIRTIQRAVVEFELLSPGDKVLVGLSGGKDSLFLLYTLTVFVKHLPFPVKVGAITVDMGFKSAEESNYQPLERICRDLEVDFTLSRVELGEEILHNKQQNPCARCAYFRRAIIHNFARENGYNKVALAHHYDDAVETFLMSILYSGQIYTFLPKTYLDKTGVTVIRPLVYLRESEIRAAVKKWGLTPLKNPCPLDRTTKRAEIKELIRNLKKDNPHVFYHLAAAMREGQNSQLWPAEPDKEEVRRKSHRFWHPDFHK